MRPTALIRIPLVAAFFAILTNPYFLSGWREAVVESKVSGVISETVTDPARIWTFLSSSLPLGFGLALVIIVVGLGFYRLFARKGPMAWYAALGLGLATVAIGYVVVGRASPPVIYFRFVSYLLPIALLMAVHRPWPYRTEIMALALALSIVQSVPTKIAQVDANDPVRGTRFAAASWIEARVPPGASICPARGRISPGNMPPIDYTRYARPNRDCDYVVKRSIGEGVSTTIPGYRLAAEFAPRLWAREFTAVHGFANPYLAIYRRADRPNPRSSNF